MPVHQVSGSMPTQSPPQKNTKLKSVVCKPPPKQPDACPTGSWQPDRALPYHSMGDKPEEFMQNIMQLGMMAHEHFSVEIDDLMFFGHKWSSIAHQIVASILYTELVWFRGYLYTFLVIPPQLEKRVPWPDSAPLPQCPWESRSHHAMGLKKNCQVWWRYLLALLQYWKDAKSLFPYGRVCRDSNLMMYVYYCIKHLLHLGKVKLQHYSVKNQMAWMVFALKTHSKNQFTKQRETYATIADELQEMKLWLHKRYEAEADAEIREVEQYRGDIWKMSRSRASADQHPGNEDLYVRTDKRGTRWDIPPTGSEFDGGNSLAHQWCRESESMERQKYVLSQDECTSLDM